MIASMQSLADLEITELARLEAEFGRRAQGRKPWTIAEYLDKVDAIHARYQLFTQYQQKQVA